MLVSEKTEGRREEWRATRERVVPASDSTMQSANYPAIQPVGQPRSRESQRRVRRPTERPTVRQSSVGARRGNTCTFASSIFPSSIDTVPFSVCRFVTSRSRFSREEYQFSIVYDLFLGPFFFFFFFFLDDHESIVRVDGAVINLRVYASLLRSTEDRSGGNGSIRWGIDTIRVLRISYINAIWSSQGRYRNSTRVVQLI